MNYVRIIYNRKSYNYIKLGNLIVEGEYKNIGLILRTGSNNIKY